MPISQAQTDFPDMISAASGTVAYLGLGSNAGDRLSNIERAVKMLGAAEGITVDKVSDIIETEPWGFTAEEKFLNCVVRIVVAADVTPSGLLDLCKRIERTLGRDDSPEYDASGGRIYHSRTIDVDILLFGRERLRTDRLTIPHPLMKERAFVMVPLRGIVSREDEEAFPEIFSV